MEDLNEIEKRAPKSIVKKTESDVVVKVANTQTEKVLYEVRLRFTLGQCEYEENFLVTRKLNMPLLGLPFFENNDIDIKTKQRLLVAPDYTLSLNMIVGDKGQTKKCFDKKKKRNFLQTVQRAVLEPNQQLMVECAAQEGEIDLTNATGVIEPVVQFEKRTGLCVASALGKLNTKLETRIPIINLTTTTITIPAKTRIAEFIILTSEQSRYLVPVDPQLLSNTDDLEKVYQQSLNSMEKPQRKQKEYVGKTDFWFPTPETCDNPARLNKFERNIYDLIVEYKNQEKLNPIWNDEDKKKFLSKFDWTDSILTEEERKKMEDLLLEYNDIFARHRFDIGKAPDFKVKLTPDNNEPVYSQPRPAPIHLRDEILTELALFQYFGIITSLPFSKYSSPIFAQRKPSGKLRILCDLRKINHLIRNDYDNNNFPISTIADANRHFAGKTLFAKFDCSQAYYAIQMADEESIQMLAFNFAGRTFAYQRLAMGLNRAVSAFSSFMRMKLDKCISADKCYSYMDDLTSAANGFPNLFDNLKDVFEGVRGAGVKLAIEKCQIGLPKIDFLGSTITSQGISPCIPKVDKFLSKLKMPQTQKQVKRLIGFFQFYRQYLPNLSETLLPFYKLLRHNSEFVITEEHKTALKILIDSLTGACDMSLNVTCR